MTSADALQERLRAQLADLLFDEYKALTEAQLGMVFALVLGDLRTRGSTGIRPTSPATRPSAAANGQTSTPKPAPPPIPRKVTQGQSEHGPWLAFELFTLEALDDLHKQIKDTSGLFIKLDQDIPLNSALDVCIILPVIDAELWLEGRVVVQAPAGTAIGLQTDADHIATWRRAREAFTNGRPLPSTPCDGPRTLPPRIQRRSGVHPPPPNNPSRPAASPSQPAVSPPRTAASPPPAQSRPPSSAHAPALEHARSAPSTSGNRAPYQTRPASGQFTTPGSSGRIEAHGPLTIEQLKEIGASVPASVHSDLSVRSLVSLLIEASGQQGDGVIRIEGQGTLSFIIMQLGCPVEIIQTPRNPDLDLGPLLVEAHKLTWEQHKEIERNAHDQGIEYSESIVRLRSLTYPEVLASLQSRIAFVLSIILKTTQGRFSYHPLEQLPHRYSTPPLSLPSLVFKNTYRELGELLPADLERTIEPFIESFPTRIEPPPCSAAELQLPNKEKRFFEVVLDSGNRLRFLIGVSNLNRTHTLALLLTLQQMGFIYFDLKKERTEIHERLLSRVETKLNSLHAATHFDVLDIH